MKILVSGGHFSPAHSVIRELISQKNSVLIAGRKSSFEGEKSDSYEYIVAKKEKIPFFEIRAGRLQRYVNKFAFVSFLKLFLGIYDGIVIIRRFKPDVVLTFGGYISFPVGVGAFLMRVPLVIHEQTQKAGLANRLLGQIATRICITFPSSFKYFPRGKIVLTGNPVRKEIFDVKKPFDVPMDKKIIYITGGSAGSHFINLLVLQIIPRLLQKYTVIHQVGDSQEFKDYEVLKAKKDTLPKELRDRYILEKFILPESIGWVFQNTTLVVSRSGVNTVIELILLGKPAFLIPLPHGQSNEQLDNAKLLKSIGIGEYSHQGTLTGKLLYESIDNMTKNIKNYLKIINFSKGYLKKDATKNITEVLVDVYEKKKKK
ncbi:MAG: hypothetical protein COU27_00475 [Candidatus Levybacteria bacterium CG10_big_fil_rev_8_21_14_0_10_36_7]|nr:MAG: hypothetical protein COU27_00475 [Candidatus Levybacteria bacterium CG10_big_fil_rev_8_21_14_0_10_36_7]